ncbi:YncE family protein [Myxococcota bacterium]
MTCHRIALTATLLGFGVGCARDLPGEAPPDHAFYFPISVQVSPDYRYAYVVSSNFDLKYNAGWVSAVDLDRVLEAVGDGAPAPVPTSDMPALLESALVSQLRVLSLAGNLALNEDGSLAILPHRGDPTVTLMEITEEGASLTCGNANATKKLNKIEEQTDCDVDHLVRLDAKETFDEELADNEVKDPFSATMFTYRPETGDELPLAAVGHLSSSEDGGRLALFEVSGRQGEEPPRLGALRAVRIGRSGVANLAVHPDTSGAFVAGASQVSGSDSVLSTIYSIDVGRALEQKEDGSWRRSDNVPWRHSINAELGGLDLLGIAFSPSGQLAFVSNRRPDSVVVLDASLLTIEEIQDDGSIRHIVRPRYSVVGATPIPDRPAGVVYVPRADVSDLVVVASFDDDVLFALTPQGTELKITGRLDNVGLGPFALARASRGGRELLLVTTFFDHGLAIFDVTPAEPTSFELLAHLRSEETEPEREAR